MMVLLLGVYVVGYVFVFGWGIWYLVKIICIGFKLYDLVLVLDVGSYILVWLLLVVDELLEEC